jgi:hypothetical protein
MFEMGAARFAYLSQLAFNPANQIKVERSRHEQEIKALKDKFAIELAAAFAERLADAPATPVPQTTGAVSRLRGRRAAVRKRRRVGLQRNAHHGFLSVKGPRQDPVRV